MIRDIVRPSLSAQMSGYWFSENFQLIIITPKSIHDSRGILYRQNITRTWPTFPSDGSIKMKSTHFGKRIAVKPWPNAPNSLTNNVQLSSFANVRRFLATLFNDKCHVGKFSSFFRKLFDEDQNISRTFSCSVNVRCVWPL